MTHGIQQRDSGGISVNTSPRWSVYRHNVSAPVPAWLYKAFLTATRKASADRIPIIVVEDTPHPFICIELNDFNELLAATASQREDVTS